MFEPIGRETLSGRIRDQLLQRITTGELEPGARMPSERALSEQFRVARTSVREAIQGLVSLGVIERRGNRSYVAEHLPDVTLTTRRRPPRASSASSSRPDAALELPIIEFAAERACDDDRAEIRRGRQARSGRHGARRVPPPRPRFHATIARACGNPLLVEVYGKVLARLFGSEEFDELLVGRRQPRRGRTDRRRVG